MYVCMYVCTDYHTHTYTHTHTHTTNMRSPSFEKGNMHIVIKKKRKRGRKKTVDREIERYPGREGERVGVVAGRSESPAVAVV